MTSCFPSGRQGDLFAPPSAPPFIVRRCEVHRCAFADIAIPAKAHHPSFYSILRPHRVPAPAKKKEQEPQQRRRMKGEGGGGGVRVDAGSAGAGTGAEAVTGVDEGSAGAGKGAGAVTGVDVGRDSAGNGGAVGVDVGGCAGRRERRRSKGGEGGRKWQEEGTAAKQGRRRGREEGTEAR